MIMQNAKRLDRVLIAEDEPDIRDYLAISLRCRGYEVEQAENGNEVLSFLKQKDNRVSLVLLDIMMPWKDGIETLREIRQLDKNIPVVMLSGISAASTIIQTMKCGADDYLTKPVTDEQLFGMIESTLATREAADVSRKKALAHSTKAIERWQLMDEDHGDSSQPSWFLGGSGPAARRDRRRQGGSRSHAPRCVSARCSPVLEGQLCCPTFGTGRERVIRLRARCFYGRL